MNPRFRFLSLTLALLAAQACVSAWAQKAAAPAAGLVAEDHSTPGLIDKATVAAIWKQGLPQARLAKLYPNSKWGLLSQVEGGLTADSTCVVTARVVLLPKTSPTRRLVWSPSKTSTTFDAKAGSNAAQCSDLAAAKLKDAVESLVSSLVKI